MDKKQIEITEKAIRSSKDNSGALVGLLNQEIEELQRVKEKQIEEMYNEFLAYKFITPIDKFSYRGAFEHLEKQGYRKINENEVVISKEEYEELLKLQKTYVEDLTYARTSFEEEKEGFKLNYDNHIKNLEKIIDRQSKDLNSQANRLIDLKAKLENKGKETAREIFSELYMHFNSDYLCGLRNPNKDSTAEGFVVSLAKQYGVDIGNNNGK